MADESVNFRTPTKRIRNKGSAKEGVHHFVVQRATAVANAFLVLWLIGSVIALGDASYGEVYAYLSNPIVTVVAALAFFSVYWHMKLGVQVVIEDYIAKESTRIVLILLLNFLTYLFGAAAILAVLRVGFGVPAAI
jgi:succinate dehydrogenase / fumarate reductase membrane anchor subunit